MKYHVVLCAACAVAIVRLASAQPTGCIDQGLNITYATDIVVDSGGNSYVTGGVRIVTGGSEYHTIKYNPLGIRVWEASYQGPGLCFDYGSAIALDAAGNVVVTGKSWDIGRRSDYATIKYDANGRQLWVARYRGPGEGQSAAHALKLDSAGNIYVTGSSTNAGGGSSFATVKYSPAGTEVWAARSVPSSSSVARDLALDSAGNTYVTGGVAGAGGNREYATAQYDANGREVWVRRFSSPSGDSSAYAIAAGSGGIHVTGASCRLSVPSQGQCGGFEFVTIRYDAGGNQTWLARSAPEPEGSYQAFAITLDSAGSSYVTGSSGAGDKSAYSTVKYNANGSLGWSARYPGGGFATPHDIAVGAGGSVYVTGASLSGATLEYATVAYNSSGTQLWAARYRGPDGRDYDAQALAIDAAGNILVTGGTLDQLVQGPNTSSYATVKYDAVGNQLWANTGNAVPLPLDAYFLVGDRATTDTFTIRLTDPAKIQKARDILAGRELESPHVMGTIVKAPAYYNPRWSYHYDSNSIDFFAFAIEVCDAAIRYVEEHLDEAGGAFLPSQRWCPWSSRLVEELPRPADADHALTSVSAASFSERALASESIATGFGLNVASREESAPGGPLPATLGGVSIRIRDAQRQEHTAPLFFVSRTQANYLVPEGVAPGVATVTLNTSDGRTLTGSSRIERMAPSLFYFGAGPEGLAAANLVRVRRDGTRVTTPVATRDASGNWAAVPIVFGPDGEELYLELYGTGIRHHAPGSLAVFGDSLPVLYAGPQGFFPGLDQVNVHLPRSLAGGGSTRVMLVVRRAEGMIESNATRVSFSATGGQ